jgi:hypothetical protein
MGPRLARHFLPAETVILGAKIQPVFSLWHQRTLSALGSAFLGGESALDFAELALAVRVCQIAPLDARGRLQEHVALRARPLWLSLRAIVFRGEKFVDELDAFLEYLHRHQAGPRPYAQEKGAGYVQSEAALYLAQGLIEIGFPPVDAWLTSPGLARFYLTAHDEHQRRAVSIWNDRRVELARRGGHGSKVDGLDY